MTDLEYDFLIRYKAAGYPLPKQLSERDRGFYKSCKSAHYIGLDIDSDGNWFYQISDLGAAAMAEHEALLEQKRKQRTEDEAQQRAQKAQAVVDEKKKRRYDLTKSLLGSLFPTIIERRAEIIDFTKQILRTIFSLFHE